MKKEDLIKKLENIETPDIEIQSHKQRLKMTLLSSRYFKEKTIMFWTKRLVPTGVALALLIVLGFTVINPKLMKARAMEIAKNDPQIKELIEEYGVEIKEVKLQDGKAYVLLTLPEEKLPPVPMLGGEETDSKALSMRGPGQFYIVYQNPETGEIIESSGSVAEIDLKAKKVEKLELIEKLQIDITPLTEEEKARAIEIARSEPKIQEMIPDLEEREVIVKPMPPLKLRLDEDPDDGVEITSADPKEDKRANVIFKSDEMQDIITVNLTTGKVEGAVSYSTGSKIEKLESEYPHPIKPKFYLEPDDIETSLPDEGEVYSIKFGPGDKSLEELLKDAELISEDEEEELKTYRLSNGDILEVKEKDGTMWVKVSTEE